MRCALLSTERGGAAFFVAMALGRTSISGAGGVCGRVGFFDTRGAPT